ncbi:MAG TPA: histidine phosphatase family protein [Pyrinomonadaceae bacterium]|nr:histidine phosphatase family protein [Pyrinomonadaceae bacterium]
MRSLYLLRHAKSSWKDDSIADVDRPLKKRGRAAAERVGKTLGAERLSSPVLISSPALRTRETTDIVLKAGHLKVIVSYDERIYEADLASLLRVIAEVAADKTELILVGHNPGMEYLLDFLTGPGQPMPTAALAKIILETASWDSVERGDGRLEWLKTPADLE